MYVLIFWGIYYAVLCIKLTSYTVVSADISLLGASDVQYIYHWE